MLLNSLLSGKNLNSLLDQPVIAGQDILAHQNLHSAVFPRALKENGEGRFLDPGDKGQPNIVISRKIAAPAPRCEWQSQEGRRYLAHRRQAVPDRRHL